MAANVAASRAVTGVGRQETSRILSQEQSGADHLRRASGAPDPAPPSVADSPPMVTGEVFAFAPYWTLGQQTTFDLSGVDTVSYFGLGVNAGGTLQESGAGWTGYQSQELADLVTRAHAAGKRVVLTVDCFSQAVLNQLTSSSAAAATLAQESVAAMRAKDLDGVNLDLEGQGPTDAAGLTRLVATVARAVHAVDPDDQVTMDTYASAAAGAGSFYDIPALAKVVNGFFVMAYDLNLGAGATRASPMTSAQFPDTVAAAQYAAAVPPSMVVFGASFFGYSWPTTNGTLAATPMGAPTPLSFGQVLASGHPMYWDPVTDTSWTSYEVGDQWYEAYFEDPPSLFMVARLAHSYGFGTGVWALGMQGPDPAMLAAIEGQTPGTGVPPAGPAETSASAPRMGAGRSAPSTTTTTAAAPVPSASKPVPAGASSSTTSTTAPVGGAGGASGGGAPGAPTYRYSGTWDARSVSMQRIQLDQQPTTADPTADGPLSGFVTTDPSVACLQSTPHPMEVYLFRSAGEYVVEARTPGQCSTADFVFPASSDSPSPSPTTG